MSLKRPITNNNDSRNKRSKYDSFSINSIILEEKECRMCKKQYKNPISLDECINYELQPKIYFSLALILADPLKEYLLLDNNGYISQLAKHTIQLARDHLLASHVLNLLVSLYIENCNAIIPLFKNCNIDDLHEEREIKFISTCLNDSQEVTVNLVKLQANKSLKINLESIVLSDIRYARLLPLLSILYNNTTKNTPTNDSLIILDEEEVEKIINSSHHNSSPLPFPLITLQDESFSICQTSNKDLDQPQTSQEEEQVKIPNYDELSTIELKAKLKTYGYKTSNNRNQMIQDLKNIFTSLFNNKKTRDISLSAQQSYVTASTTPCYNDEELELSIDTTSNDDATRTSIIQHLRSKEDIMKEIWLYNAANTKIIKKKKGPSSSKHFL
ncbi:uncharacterized protein BX663DRAFT_8332 [Cokeromyces recurvatus]|uniref:uncharacterized protein n=1 Tax=Cokeromyces recurvatus TaxID=90255 RepID=UPI00221EAF12|nr:uncharacterized protein BX663DRAFT_8332 [Cokeromyces recurvatus]KAI7907688.1 hypothetical protein BX663DRAFT_8332 [Cokeromyces recurvatus]